MFLNELTVQTVATNPSLKYIYVVLIVVLIAAYYFINKMYKINIFDLTLENTFLICEIVSLPVISALFGAKYIAFSLFLLYFGYINMIYIKTGVGNGIEDQRELVRQIVMYYIKPLVISIIMSFILGIFVGLIVVGFYVLFLLACFLMVFVYIMSHVKVEEEYKLLTASQVNKLLGDYDTNTLFRTCYANYITIQKNLCTNTIDNVSNLLSPEMLIEYQNKQKDNLSKQARLIIDEESYISGGLIDYKNINGVQSFKMELVYNMKSYVGHMETGRVLSGSSTRLKKITSLMEFDYINNNLILKSERIFKEE